MEKSKRSPEKNDKHGKTFKDVCRKIYYTPRDVCRKLYYVFKKIRLHNYDPTIIASDCVGTFMYHNLGLQFRSPTINLFIPKEDFLKFVNNLEEYLKAEPYEITDSGENYPVGELLCPEGPVRLHFVHYKSFEEAKEKWNIRKQRVSFSNIFIVMHCPDASKKDVEDFHKLPYKNKFMLTNVNHKNEKDVFTNSIYTEPDYYNGKILDHEKGFHFYRRYMDSVDYVKFLNQKNN